MELESTRSSPLEHAPRRPVLRDPAWWLELGMRLVLGGAFLGAGLLKLQDPGLFATAIRNFDLVGDPLVALLAVFLPWMELIAGAGIVVRFRPVYRGSLVVLSGALLAFILALAISWMRGLEISCGCFGGVDETTNYPLVILRNGVFLALAAALWWRDHR